MTGRLLGHWSNRPQKREYMPRGIQVLLDPSVTHKGRLPQTVLKALRKTF
jgi:hypothetical protein